MKNKFYRSAAVIGIGRLGSTLARSMKHLGCRELYIFDLEAERIETLTAELDAKIIDLFNDGIQAVNLWFITVPDDKISETARGLANAPISWINKIVIHCSGAYSSTELEPLAEKGAKTLSIHPMQSFTLNSGIDKFKGIYCGIEGGDVETGIQIVQDLGGIPIRIETEKKTLYHASAVTASNHLLGLLKSAVQIGEYAGLSSDEALKMLLPLVSGTISNVYEYGLNGKCLTGPLSRGDKQVVKEHLEALKNYPELLEYYQITARMTLGLADLDDDTRREMLELLNSSD
ncbi:DUF2520 domain-containing protein [bacterium]|nr:DUF2520 domain-containing protein [FCB group bacterium]MBL7192319.1 DUF2520 domain-containing protein [bacterium]